MPLHIQTPRFVIREFRPDDRDAYMALYDDEDVILHLPKRSKQENLDVYQGALDDYAAGKSLGRWGIFNNHDGEYTTTREKWRSVMCWLKISGAKVSPVKWLKF